METMNINADTKQMICKLGEKAEKLSDQILFWQVPHHRTKREKAAWLYAKDLLERIKESCKWYPQDVCNLFTPEGEVKSAEFQRYLLNGARNWTEYSEDGNSLIYNDDISERIFTKGEQIKAARRGYDYLWWQGEMLSIAAEMLEQILCHNVKSYLN